MSGNHRFTKLGNISRKDRQVNVFAVVKFFKKPSKTKGSDMSFFFTIVDPTLFENEKSIKCLFFEKNKENFPIITNIGDIVKFTSLRISVFKDQIQGRNKINGFSWITFDGRPNAPVVPRFSANSPQIFTDEDKKNVEGLKQWAASVHFLSLATSQRSLAELAACEDLYFNLLCQVVAVDKHDASKKYDVLHVWDGTVPALSRLKSDYDDSFSSATKWGAKLVGNCIEICVFPNDAELTVNPGDYVQITNLHLKNDTPGEGAEQGEVVSEAQKLPSLRLHEGNSFGRGLKIILEDDPDIKQLENRMDALITTSGPRTESFVQRREVLVTSNDHSTVFQAPSTVSQAPSTVSQAPSTVSKAPSTVSQAPSTVSKAPSTVSKALSNPCASDSLLSTHHRFTMLGNISRMDHRVNVFAVVKFFKKPTKTKGIDMSFFFTLVHPTLFEHEQSLKCLFFAKNEVKFPVITNIGDIVKFTSLDITVFKDQIQGRNKNGFSWITFDGRPNAPVVPRFPPNSTPIVTDEDRKNVEELKKWAASIDFLSVTTSRRSLAELTACEEFYFDLLCQVVSVGKHDATTKYVALHVWDGTVPSSSVSRLKSMYDYSFSSTTKWGAKVIGNCIQICVFLKDSDSELTVNPGDYVQITNLHLTFKEDTHAEGVTDQGEVVSESAREAQKVPFIILHEGSSFGRGIRLLQEDDPDIRQLVNRMEALQAGVIQRPSGNGASVLPAVPEHLHFTRLRKISTTDFCLNMFGVVKSFRRPAQSKGCDRSFCFSLVDSSMYKDEACLKCLFFEKNDANFPVINNIGDVIRFTSLGITIFQGRFQGRNDKRGFSWMTFDGRSNAPVVPRFSPNSPATFTERDERIVKCLKKWATSVDFLSRATSRRSLSELIDDDTHFDLLCQVVAVEERDATSRSVVLHVWDGTVPALNTVKSEDDHSFSSATGWGAKVVGNCVKIYVSQKDRDPAVPCYPEDYVQLTNLCLTSKERAMAGEAMGDEVVENEGTRQEVIAEESSESEVIEKDVTKEETGTVQVAAKDAKSAEEYKMEEAASLQKVLFLLNDRRNFHGPRLRLLRLHNPDVMMLIDRIEVLPSPPSVPGVKIPTPKMQSAIAQHPANSSASVSGKGEAEKLLINNRVVCGEPSEIPLRDTQMKASHFPPVSKMSQGPANRGASACGKGETRKEQAMEEETIGAEVLAKGGVEQQRTLNPGSASVGSASVGLPSVGSAPVGSASVGLASVGSASVGSASVGLASVGSASVGLASVDEKSKNLLTRKRKLCKEPTEALFGNGKVEDNAISNVAIPGQELAAGSSGLIVPRPASKRRIRRCSIAKVVERPSAPITFICRARVWNYCPEDASEYVKYVCRSCRNVCNPRELSDAGGTRTCPRSSCGKPLSLTLCVSLILTDDTSCLDVILFGNEAQEFFSDVDPTVLLTDEGVQRSVTERMRSLREGKILLDFVVKSYYGPEDENGDELIMYKIKKTRYPVQLA